MAVGRGWVWRFWALVGCFGLRCCGARHSSPTALHGTTTSPANHTARQQTARHEQTRHGTVRHGTAQYDTAAKCMAREEAGTTRVNHTTARQREETDGKATGRDGRHETTNDRGRNGGRRNCTVRKEPGGHGTAMRTLGQGKSGRGE